MELTDKIQIFNCDCMELMKKTPDNYYSLSIVDPPYGINIANASMGRGSALDKGKLQKKSWDKYIPNKEYFIELQRVSKNQIIWGGNYFIDYLQNTRCLIIWDKKDYNSDFADGECAWTSFDKNLKIYQRARAKDGNDKGKIHPTQKPIQLYKWLLKNYAKPTDKILDTHSGSGSFLIAAHYFGCEAVACEIDKEYYNDSIKRFKENTIQLDCFDTSIKEDKENKPQPELF